MFGLPTSTTWILFGIPALWVLYTLIFVYRSRHWKAEDVEDNSTAVAANSAAGSTSEAGGAA